jgi:predicted DNA-binding protein
MSILRQEGGMMKDALSRYTLRVSPVLLQKLGYIAEFEGRTKNKEIERLIKIRIAEFEAEHGEIGVEPKE